MESVKWEVFDRVVFKDENNGEEFLLTKRKKPLFGIDFFDLLNGAIAFSALFNKDDKIGTIGTGKVTNLRKVSCPYCKTIQSLVNEKQRCINCNKKFYLW